MSRIWISCLLLLIGTVSPADAQNPFLQNRGARTVEEIRFEGNERTQEYVLRRELGFAEGDDYDPEAMTSAWERLERLPFIAYVEIETERPGAGLVVLLIRIVEEPQFHWTAGLEYERRHGKAWIGQAGLGYMNLRGRGESLTLRTEGWKRRGGELTWANPWILGDARLGLDLRTSWTRYDWVYSPYSDNEFTDWGFAAGLHRSFAGGVSAHAVAQWREIDLENAMTGHDHALAFTIEHDSRDAQYYPTAGAHATATVRFAGLGHETPDYTIFDVTQATFVPIPRFATLAGFFGVRRASSALPFYEQTYFGGPMSIRGVPFGNVRGDDHFRASIELRRAIALVPLREGRAIGLGVHAFHDWGKAWFDGEDHDLHPVHRSFGAGLHFSLNTHNYCFQWAQTEDGENMFVFEDSFHF